MQSVQIEVVEQDGLSRLLRGKPRASEFLRELPRLLEALGEENLLSGI